MSVLQAVRKANQPGPPEDSIRLRAACLATVGVAIEASASMGEISQTTAVTAIALVALGMVFSYATRARPRWWIKVAIALAAIAASARFFHTLTAPGANISTVEDPLIELLVSILVVHSFHVPSRRDLMFSLAASAGLMAVGGAQAIELDFGWFLLAWAGCSLWGLLEMWNSASGGRRPSALHLVSSVVAVAIAAAAIFLFLPAPTVGVRTSLLSRAGLGGSVGVAGALAGDSGSPAQLAKAGTTSDPTRIGGYLGFANSLDTALRGNLSKQLVMLVRAEQPSYWVGETFDTWDGENWSATDDPSHDLRQGSPFLLPTNDSLGLSGQSDLQTFYVVSSTANLVFHAQSADELWFPSRNVHVSGDGAIVSPIGLGAGSIYSVESQVSTATPAELRQAAAGVTLNPSTQQDYLQLPHPYPEAQSLAQSITAGDTTNYDRVESLIAWIGTHTHYSTDIPPLPAGADTVDEFLFGNRVGFCEQISTSLAVMLRSIGIPAREVVGYVPGPYNPVTDLYQVRADDAHAWVQVWFPGYGWQSFDPTAVVPLANPAPGVTALGDLGHAFAHIPVTPVAAALLAAVVLAAALRWRRSRPRNWMERIARNAERAGRRIGHPRRPHETLLEYAAMLDGLMGDGSAAWRALATPVEASAYGDREPSAEDRRRLVAQARRLRTRRRRN